MYPTLKQLNWPQIEAEILAFWEQESVFQQSVDQRHDAPSFTFFEGPPSPNGMPGIHHVAAASSAVRKKTVHPSARIMFSNGVLMTAHIIGPAPFP